MPTWQEQRARLQGYLRPWPIVKMGVRFLFEARPIWLGGSPRPEGISVQDHVSGKIFQTLASGFKAFEGQFTQVPTLVASAHGIVLEVGPGVGTQLDRFDKTKIEHVYGIELNPAFVPSLLAEVEKSSLQGKYTVISGSVEDAKLLAQHGVAPGTVDSVVCIGTLCSVQNPAATVKWIYELLKPGGSFIFWEHRRSHDFVTRLVQGFWNPIWRYFMGGCDLRRLNGDAIKNAGAWEQQDSDFGASKSVAQEWSIMPRVEGILTKKKI